MGFSRANQTTGGENSRSRESKMWCHQCRHKDKVVCCSKCKTKRYCLTCITRWYPGMTEEDFLKACPVCRNLCNCIICLRLDGLAKHLMNVEVKFSDEEKLEYSKHIVRALLPALEQFNTEQMIEKQIIRFKHWQIQRLKYAKKNSRRMSAFIETIAVLLLLIFTTVVLAVPMNFALLQRIKEWQYIDNGLCVTG